MDRFLVEDPTSFRVAAATRAVRCRDPRTVQPTQGTGWSATTSSVPGSGARHQGRSRTTYTLASVATPCADVGRGEAFERSSLGKWRRTIGRIPRRRSAALCSTARRWMIRGGVLRRRRNQPIHRGLVATTCPDILHCGSLFPTRVKPQFVIRNATGNVLRLDGHAWSWTTIDNRRPL
jgi:hypothetical protein